MIINYKDLHNGKTVYAKGAYRVVNDFRDPHNVVTTSPGGMELVCMVPGCREYLPVHATKEESEADVHSSGLPMSYVKQNGCHNCAHSFVHTDDRWDCLVTELFCTCEAPPRPPCPSEDQGELGHPRIPKGAHFAESRHLFDSYDVEVRKWELWARGQRVDNFGICGNWQPEGVAND